MQSQIEQLKRKQPKQKLGLFFFTTWIGVSMLMAGGSVLAAIDEEIKSIEELDGKERMEWIAELISRGDRYKELKNFDLANAMYERVFLLDAENLQASKRIDQLKKEMLEDGQLETGIVGGAYDAEIEARLKVYWREAQQLIRDRRWGRARFALEKLLMLDPLHEEASDWHKRLSEAIEEGREPDGLALDEAL